MRNALVVTGLCLLVALALAPAGIAQPGKGPLSLDDIERLLQGGVTPVRVATLVTQVGVAFEITGVTRSRLERAGADADLMAVIEQAAAPRLPSPAPTLIEPIRQTEPKPTDPPARTALVVRTNVSGDEVRIGGRSVGESGPKAHDVPAGRHRVIVRREGYRTAERQVVAREGEIKIVTFTLDSVEEPPTPTPPEPTTEKGMVFVGGGPFFMGCNESVDSECDEDEKPGRTVDVAPFQIDKNEVTVDEYRECVSAGRCGAGGTGDHCNWGRAGRERHPINCVSWDQAVAYCVWRGKRLPSEAEWEKAARGADKRKYPWGNVGYEAGRQVANICDASCELDWRIAEYDDGHAETAPVGSYPDGASPFGALDMVGNVWEWVSDWRPGKVSDARVGRGGSWSFQAQDARASNRYRYVSGARNTDIGFRCAR